MYKLLNTNTATTTTIIIRYVIEVDTGGSRAEPV